MTGKAGSRAGPWCVALGCAALFAGATAHARDLWERLWFTPPQRAERLLEAGHAGAAARLFKNPRRRAYAELRAGQYAQAAKGLAPFHDPQSEYNRGNALARAGKLRAALAAYDAALAKAPHDRDVRHNRNLVARALRHRAGHGAGGRSGSRGHQGAGRRSGSGSAHGAGSRSGAARAAGSHSAGAQGARGRRRSGAGNGSSSNSAGTQGETPKQRAARARADAEFAARLARQAARRAHRSARAGRSGANRGASGSAARLAQSVKHGAHSSPTRPPVSEKTLALRQWLRRIPDDPAGLLRRKFLIEHLEREQREQEAASGASTPGPSP